MDPLQKKKKMKHTQKYPKNCFNLFGPMSTNLDLLGLIWSSLDLFVSLWASLHLFGPNQLQVVHHHHLSQAREGGVRGVG